MRMPLTWRIPKELIDLAEKNKILSFKSWESRAVLGQAAKMFFLLFGWSLFIVQGKSFVAVQKLYWSIHSVCSLVGWIVTKSWEWTSSCNTLIFSSPSFLHIMVLSFSSLIIPSSMLTARSILRWGRRNPWIGSWSPPEKFQVPFHLCKG